MKILNIAFVIIFIIFAGLQYNDPDPYVWMPIYLYGALFCWLSFRNKFYLKAYIFGSVVCAIYALYKVFDENGLIDWITKPGAQNITETMKAETPCIEETSEFLDW